MLFDQRFVPRDPDIPARQRNSGDGTVQVDFHPKTLEVSDGHGVLARCTRWGDPTAPDTILHPALGIIARLRNRGSIE